MQLTEDFIRRIARRINQTSGGATISNLINGVTTVGKAVEANHATTAGNLDSDSSDWETIDNKDTAVKNAANQYTDEQLAEALKDLANKFLSKTGDDSAAGFITFLAGIYFGELKKYGITAEGVATLLNLILEGDATVGGNLTVGGDTTVSSLHTPGASKGSDQSGSGFYLWVDGGVASMVLDNLTVRGKWTAAVLEVLKLQYTAGNLTLTGAGGEIYAVEALDADGNVVAEETIEADTTANKTDAVDRYRCYFKATDGERHVENLWHTGDMARCQTFNLTDGTYTNAANRMYYRVVTGVSGAVVEKSGAECFWIDLSNKEALTVEGTDCYGLMHTRSEAGVVSYLANDAPEAGDSVAQVGSVSDTDRQGAVQLVAVGGPAIRIYGGVNETLEDLSRFMRITLSPSGSSVNTRWMTLTNGWKENRPMIECGDWTEGTVAHASEVWQYGGSSWLCEAEETKDAPQAGSASWRLLASKGDDGGSAYDVQLSRYQGMLTVDSLGNVINGLYTTVKQTNADGEEVDVRQYRVSTAVFVRKGLEILTEDSTDSGDSTDSSDSTDSGGSGASLASPGHFKIHVMSDDCECFVANSTVYVKSINNLHDSDAVTEETIDYDAMRRMAFCRVSIVVDLEGKASKTIEFPIRIAHDAQPFMACDLTNEHGSVGWNSKGQTYYGLPLSTGVSLMKASSDPSKGGEVYWAVSYITVKAQGVAASVDTVGGKAMVSLPQGYTATTGADLDGNTAIITLLPKGLKCTIADIKDSTDSGDSTDSTDSGNIGKLLTLELDGTGTGDFLPKVLNLVVHVVGVYAGVSYEYDKVWTISKASDVTIYDVVPTVDQIVVDSDGVMSATAVGCSVMATSSDDSRYSVGADMLAELGLRIEYGVDTLSSWKDYTDVVSVSEDNLYVAFRLVDTAGAVEYDRETVPVVRQGKDGTSWRIDGTAAGYWGQGSVDIQTVDAYIERIGYTKKSGDIILSDPMPGDGMMYTWDGTSWTQSTPEEGSCWLIDNASDAKDGHIMVYRKNGQYTSWKDMGNLRGPAGKDGADAEGYEMEAVPGQLHRKKDGTWDGGVAVRLWHYKGGARTEVAGAAVSLSFTGGSTGTATLPLTLSPTGGDWQEAIAADGVSAVVVGESAYGASELTIPIVRDGEDGAGGEDGVAYRIDPSAVVVTELADLSESEDGVWSVGNYRYTGIPTSVAIHKTVGAEDSVVAADTISVDTAGARVITATGWAETLQENRNADGSYDLSRVLTSEGLQGGTGISKLVMTFTVDTIPLELAVYINRLGTVSTKTIGDTTNTARRRLVSELKDGYVSQTDYEAYTEAGAERFVQNYKATTVETGGDGKEYTVQSWIRQTADEISTSVEDTAKGLQSQITQNAGRIEQKVSQEDVDGHLQSAGITIESGGVTIDGDKTTITGDLQLGGSFWGVLRRKAIHIGATENADLIEAETDAVSGTVASVDLEKVGSYVIFDSDCPTYEDGISIVLPTIPRDASGNDYTAGGYEDKTFDEWAEYARTFVGCKIMVYNYSGNTLHFEGMPLTMDKVMVDAQSGLFRYESASGRFDVPQGCYASFECVAAAGTGNTGRTDDQLEERVLWNGTGGLMANEGSKYVQGF